MAHLYLAHNAAAWYVVVANNHEQAAALCNADVTVLSCREAVGIPCRGNYGAPRQVRKFERRNVKRKGVKW